MRDAPTQRAGSDAEVERSQPDRRARFVLPVLAMLSVLFFAGALAYAVGGGFLGGPDEEGAGLSDRSERALPRDWANMIPLQPVDPDLRPDSGTAGASEDFGSRSPGDEDASGGSASGPGAAAPLAAAPSALSAAPRRVPLLRRTVRRVPALVDLTPSRSSVPELPDLGGSVPDVDLPGGDVKIPPILPDGVEIPPILPDGVAIPPILPGGVQIPPVGPLPGVPVVPPVDPLPGGGGLPLLGGGSQPWPGGLPSPGGVALLGDSQGLSGAREAAPVLPLVSVASLSVDWESAPAREAAKGEATRREDPGGTASAASKLRAVRVLRVRQAPVGKTPLAPDRDTRPDGPRRADSDERPLFNEQDTSTDCGPGPDPAPFGSTDPGCDEIPADADESSDRQPQREAPQKPSRDSASRAEVEEGF